MRRGSGGSAGRWMASKPYLRREADLVPASRPYGRRRVGPLAVAISIPTVLAVIGAGFLLAGISAMRPGPPGPPFPGPLPGSSVWASSARVPGMTRSEPVRLEVPAIGVSSLIAPVGIAPDHTVDVPPLSRPNLTGWYRYGPSPGQVGSAVILGHVDSSLTGKAVFYDLGRLRHGDLIDVSRRDGSIAEFRVDATAVFGKNQFPSATVYGHVAYPGLRLITCGGPYDRAAGGYRDNVVVFASLTAARHPLFPPPVPGG